MANWDDEEEEFVSSTSAVVSAPKSKWDDEEDSDAPILDSWDADSEDEAKKSADVPAPQPRKKVSIQQRVAEREEKARLERERKLAELAEEENETEAERRARLQRMQLESDLNNAADLFGGVDLDDDTKQVAAATAEVDLASLPLFQPKTKAEFEELSKQLADVLTGLAKAPNYMIFLPQFMKALAAPLSSDNTRKCTSVLTAYGNEKLKDEKAAEKNKGKKKSAAKPNLSNASAKIDDSRDTTNFSKFDDFDDFM
ncbi:eukaryotic translation initiation factor 3 subunit J [Dipodascopsis tothii]|uniref:eukaryotic translation initiation factor 3 subunit J n=1 Tax=Dipodascopsis tothii TaxID=44089 RepID=UPI0034CD9DD3